MNPIIFHFSRIQELDGTLFDWLTWRNGSPLDVFGIECRSYDLERNADTLRRYIIGWCSAEQVLCRPKIKNIAVMFLKNDHYFWFHFRNPEAKKIFDIH
jgi:hypothetical protein